MKNDRVVTAVEYGAIAALVLAVCITVITTFGAQVSTAFQTIVTAL